MKKFIWVFVIIFLGAFLAAGTLWAQSFMPGKWTITMVTQIEGMDEEMAQAAELMKGMTPEQKAMMNQMMGGLDLQMDVGPEGMTTTFTQCLNEANPVPDLKETKGCEMTYESEGNETSFKAVCPESTVTGKVLYKETTMSGDIVSQQMVDGKQTTANIKMTGQYVGPCRE